MGDISCIFKKNICGIFILLLGELRVINVNNSLFACVQRPVFRETNTISLVQQHLSTSLVH